MTPAQLRAMANSLETKAGITTPSNGTEAGEWRRIALAAEAIASTSTSTSENIPGYMLRTAIALEIPGGTTGTEENHTFDGYLKRIVDALEAKSSTAQGSLGHRAQLSSFSASIFNPMSMSPSLWIDAANIASLFQDTAGTIPITAAGQTIARINDKSGSGKHLTQATTGQRPAFRTGRNAWEGDGVNDVLATPSGMTWPSSVDLWIVLSNAIGDTTFILGNSTATAGNYIGVSTAGDVATTSTDLGTPVVPQFPLPFVGNVEQGTRGALHSAITTGGTNKIFEHRAISLVNYTQIFFGSYSTFEFGGRYREVLICPAQTDAVRAQYRSYLTTKWA